MADTDVKLPVLGEVSKKTLLIGGAVAAGVLGYVWYRRYRSGAAAASSGAASGTTAASSAIDPQTGYPSGSPEDEAALAAADGLGTGYGQDYGTGYTGAGGIGPTGEYFDPLTGQYDLPSPYTGTTTTVPVTTNAQWEQEAIADLEAGGVSQATVNAAESGLPRYLAKLTLSSAQGSAVQQAVGLAGQPPEGGPYAIRIAPDHTHKPSADVKVPDVLGLDYATAASRVKAAGLKAEQSGAGKVVQERPAQNTEVKRGSTVVLFGANK
jgi:hypothetical protein